MSCLRSSRTLFFLFALALLLQEARSQGGPSANTPPKISFAPLVDDFKRAVGSHFDMPSETLLDYVNLLSAALLANSIQERSPKFVVLIDRNPEIQVLMLFWGTINNGWALVGTSSISTGLPGRYEHFKTPLGVFDHSRKNPDFRAEGTKNKFGIHGYGDKGGRIYDFGWVKAPRGWGDGHMGELRLQMHSTDRDLLEQRLGTAQSEGCIRITAELNEFLDFNGILDADYESVVALGSQPWVLRRDRVPTPWSGRYIVVVESAVSPRPHWAERRQKYR